MTAPTFTATNPINHDFFYDLDVGSGFSGVWKNLYFKGSNVTTAFAAHPGWTISSTTTVTLTPLSTSVTGSISGNVLTVSAWTSGKLYEGYIVTGTGIAANTIITRVIDAKNGKTGTYEVSTIAFPGGTSNPTISATNQTVSSTAITGSSSTYGILVGDNIFDITTPANIPATSTVASITSATVFTMSVAGTNAASQALAFASIHNENSIVSSTGFKMKIKTKTNTYAANNLLTTIAVPTVVTAAAMATQYPLDTVPVTVTVKDGVTLAPVQNARVRIITTVGSNLVLTGTTNSSGVITGTTQYIQDVQGQVRRATVAAGTLYKAYTISATVGAAGLDLTVLLTRDE
jgi:hypothetical protein